MSLMTLVCISIVAVILFFAAKKYGNAGMVLAANSFLDYVVEMVVANLEQTVKKEMKNMGQWNDTGKRDIKDRAVAMALEMVDGKVGGIIEGVYGGLKEVVSARIETQVLRNKK